MCGHMTTQCAQQVDVDTREQVHVDKKKKKTPTTSVMWQHSGSRLLQLQIAIPSTIKASFSSNHAALGATKTILMHR